MGLVLDLNMDSRTISYKGHVIETNIPKTSLRDRVNQVQNLIDQIEKDVRERIERENAEDPYVVNLERKLEAAYERIKELETELENKRIGK